jgi:hypothetical protein
VRGGLLVRPHSLTRAIIDNLTLAESNRRSMRRA